MELKRYFNEEWSVVDSKKPNGRFACMLKEVSYTFLSHTVEGLMGLKADSLQAEWLDFADKAARGELPAQKQLQKQLDSVGAQ